MNKIKNGRVTIPTDKDFEAETIRIMAKWGADAIRDCDGTVLSDEIMGAADKVYKTYFVTRGDYNWAAANLDERQHFYVMSNPFTATDDPKLVMHIMEGYFSQQIAPDFTCDIQKYWEVVDRTTNEVVKHSQWVVDEASVTVTLLSPVPYHVYTVSYLAITLWDSTQMYNYLTNNWTKTKDIPYDPRYEKTGKYILAHMRDWLKENPRISVVRFTTFLYHFALLFNEDKKEKFVDWFGYSASVSPKALEDFYKEYGYRLRAEDFVDEGYYNSPFRVPSKAFLDYMDFIQRFVCSTAKALVDEVHAAGREAMMFLGDTWIGTEPYGKYFSDIGLDAVVGSVGGGVTVRMLSDMPGIKYSEGRFLPYFFPDTFYEGNDPLPETNRNWLTARRAILRNPIDRIGYGGYLSLAAKFPKFIDRVTEICAEFRDIYDKVKDNKPHSGVRVGIVNAWGEIRSWQCFMVAHELWYKQIYSYQGILEALSGMDVDVKFLRFDDVIAGGVPQNIDVLINAGDAGTAFSGGEYWNNEKLVARIRSYVYGGGGLIGVGEPTAYLHGGRFFQLSDVLGVDKELGFTLSTDKYNVHAEPHFITDGIDIDAFDGGEKVNNIYAHKETQVLGYRDGNVTMAANACGKGRGFYTYGLRYSAQNARLLRRALFWCAGKEAQYLRYTTDNPFVECSYYPDSGDAVLVNNSLETQSFTYYDGDGLAKKDKLAPCVLKWLKV